MIAKAGIRSGKPADFVDEDTQLLRDAAIQLKEQRNLSGVELGKLLGIAQQNASRFTKGNGGISRNTANRLAEALGYRDSEGLLREAKAVRGMVLKLGNVWASRDSAVRVAQAVGWPQDCIDAVLARYPGPEMSRRETRWWLEQIALEAIGRRT